MTLKYDGPIIDAHHHLWDLSLDRHPWLSASRGARGGLGDLAPLRRNYLPEDYRRDAARHNIVASVHVEAGWADDDCLGETRWLETLDKTDRVAARYVDQILKGANPGDLPIRYPYGYFLTINAAAAKALGMVLPPALLVQADRVLP